MAVKVELLIVSVVTYVFVSVLGVGYGFDEGDVPGSSDEAVDILLLDVPYGLVEVELLIVSVVTYVSVAVLRLGYGFDEDDLTGSSEESVRPEELEDK